MKNPFPDCPSKLNMGILVPPGCSSEDRELVVRAAGELSGDAVVAEWQILEQILRVEEGIIRCQLSALTERTGMPITQENGQRRYGPPVDIYITPPRGSEVFVGKLPRDCYEPELIPVLEKAGRIYEVRLMMNFSGNNRGYCFVKYFSPQEADQAVACLNLYELRKGVKIGVTKSVDNCRLFIGRLPKDKNRTEIFEELSKLISGVQDVIVKEPSKADRYLGCKNRGYVFVEFNDHRSAAMARRKLFPGTMKLFGQDFAVDWADPGRAHREPKAKAPVKNDLQMPPFPWYFYNCNYSLMQSGFSGAFEMMM